MGVAEVQAALVDDIKRRALRALHRTPRGEALVLRTYLWAEELAEGEVLDETAAGAPAWLARQLERHAADERRHALLLRARLAQLGADATLPGADALCRRKLDRLRALAAAWAPRFVSRVVPLLAVACGMEKLGVRVMSRHLAVLAEEEAETGCPHPTATLLRRIVVEERGHVAGCERALAKLVETDELPLLEELRREIDAVDRAWGVTGALTFLALGGWLQLRGMVDAGSRRGSVDLQPAVSELPA